MTPTELLREDAEARRRALDVARSVIVQAPAGSGKTELLTQRFLALLKVVDKPEAVLAITFTLKAAAEMRERILDALRRCEDSDADLLDTTRTLARAVIKVDVERQWGLLRNPSRLRVLTIDALNQSLARRLPVLSGLGAGLGVDEEGTRLYTQAAERLLTHLATGDARSADAVATVLEHLDNNVAELVSLTTAMLARREAWLPVLPADVAAYGDEGAVREELEAGRRDIVEANLAQVRNAFPSDLLIELSAHAHESGQILRRLGRQSHICACRPGIPSIDAESLSHWQGLTQFLLTGEGQPRKQFNRTVGVLAKDDSRPELAERKARVEESAREFAQHDRLHTLLAMVRDLPPAQYRDDEWRVLRALLLVLRLAAGELKSVFAERRAADHPEFAAAARQALGSDEEPTDTALALDVRLRHILVDEFQDTSEAQVRLLERLTAGWERGDGRTLFLVGDPMQSIYRFRNAEVGLFLDVRDHGLAELRLDPVTLRVNFRSTRPVVEWVNRSFVDVLPGHDDVLRGAVRFAESVAAPNATDDGGVLVHAFLRSSRRLEAQTVADIVERRLSESADARIGILVQGRGHLVEIVQELVQRRIAFEATDIDPLGARPAVLDVLALTRALAHPGDRAAWIGVLRAPWCGLRLEDLHALLADERDAAVLRLLEDPARVARLEPAARTRVESCRAVLVQALDERRRLGLRDTVARAWHALGGPATLARDRDLEEVRAYFDALGNVERESPGAPVDFARLADALQRLYAPARPSPETRIELMTIHKSKGLQFDTVVVPGLDRITQKDTPPLLRWLKLPGQGGHRLIIAPIAGTGSETRNPLHTWLGRVEQEKLLQERRRLLYVAATRAERSLHLLGTCAVDTDETTGQRSVRAPDQDSALGLLWAVPEIAGAFEARLADIDAIAGEQNAPIPRDPILLRLPDSWHPPAPPAAPPIVVREVRRRTDDSALEFDWASETARHVGTVVHRELRRLARGTVDAVDLASIRTALEARYVVELAELGVPQERRAAAASRAFTAIQRTLADERGRWLLATSHRDAESELALSGRVGPDIVSIIIDRTFVDATGTRWIIDYKTSTHEGAGLNAFLDNERERYRPQLERYAELVGALGNEPIRLGLYFPLMSAWREWAPGDAAGGVALKSR